MKCNILLSWTVEDAFNPLNLKMKTLKYLKYADFFDDAIGIRTKSYKSY